MVEVIVRESKVVKPAEEETSTPREPLWLSNVDLAFDPFHFTMVYFYRRPSGAEDFFNPEVLRQALSKALVLYYPMAGRFKRNGGDGRVEIDCNDEGVHFVVSESSSVVDDFGDFAPTSEYHKLIPAFKYSPVGITSYPNFVAQVTYFKCGGVSLAVGQDHRIVDGYAAADFVNTWSAIARGDVDYVRINPPFMDRTVLRSRDPPQPAFSHIEYHPSPEMKLAPNDQHSTSTSAIISIFTLTRGQLDILKAKSKDDGQNTNNYSTFEMLAGHIWRCVCKARRLCDDQDTKLFVATDGRARFKPPLPPRYFGNVVFNTTPVATARDLLSKPTWYAASLIHNGVVRMDNDYLRSMIDFRELHSKSILNPPITCPNLWISSWIRLPVHDTDFGWGRPIFMGPGAMPPFDGMCFILPCAITNDGSLTFVISLQSEHMKSFSKLLYDDI